MRKRTPELDDLFHQLYQPEHFWQKIAGGVRENKVGILQEIADTGNVIAIPGILNSLFSHDHSVAEAAATAIHRLLSQVSSEDYIWFEYRMRELIDIWSGYSHSWYNLTPGHLEQFAAFDEAYGSLLGIASYHHDGYVREKAVRLLSSIHDGSELPFLLIRVNDWVEQVRDAAQQAVTARITPEYASRFAENLLLVIRLQRSKRGEYAGLVQQMFDLVKRPEASAILRANFASDDKLVRRMSYQLALESPASDQSDVLDMALKDKDTVVRIQTIKWASNNLGDDELSRLLDRAIQDPLPQVRRLALDITVERFPNRSREKLEAALLDMNAAVRDSARFHLRRMGEAGFADFYRSALSDKTGDQLAAAISGIGETGEPDDAERLIPFTSQGCIRVRKSAIRSIARLDGAAYIPLFINALLDEQSGIWKTGRNALIAYARQVGAKRLRELYFSDHRRHVRESVLLALMHLDKWSSLPYLIRARSDEHTADLARVLLDRWLMLSNRTFTSPTPEQLAEIKLALDACGSQLDEHHRASLLFTLSAFDK